jgi:hypothetical protein
MQHPTSSLESLAAHHHHSTMQRPTSRRESLTGNDRWSGWLLSRTTLHPPVEVRPHRVLLEIPDGKDMSAFDDHSQSRDGTCSDPTEE